MQIYHISLKSPILIRRRGVGILFACTPSGDVGTLFRAFFFGNFAGTPESCLRALFQGTPQEGATYFLSLRSLAIY